MTKPDEKPSDEKRPWGDDFDEERAWSLITNLRTDKAALQARVAELDEAVATTTKERDAAKSDADAAKKERDADRRAAILKEFDITEDDAAEFLPDGLAMEELRRKAERLAGRSKKSDDGDDKKDEPGADEKKDEPGDDGQEPKVPGRPEPKLTPGHGAAPEGSDLDLDAIAASARRR